MKQKYRSGSETSVYSFYFKNKITVQIGDGDAAVCIAASLSRKDPFHPLSRRLLAAAASSAHSKTMIDHILSSAPLAWSDSGRAQRDAFECELRNMALVQRLPALEVLPSVCDTFCGNAPESGLDNLLEGWSAEERLVLKLDAFGWAPLLQQVPVLLFS